MSLGDTDTCCLEDRICGSGSQAETVIEECSRGVADAMSVAATGETEVMSATRATK
jgi:hypothetical protein